MGEFAAAAAEKQRRLAYLLFQAGRFVTMAARREQKTVEVWQRRQERLGDFLLLSPEEQANRAESLAVVISTKLKKDGGWEIEPQYRGRPQNHPRKFTSSPQCRVDVQTLEPMFTQEYLPGTTFVTVCLEESDLAVAPLTLNNAFTVSAHANDREPLRIPLDASLSRRSVGDRENVYRVLQEIEQQVFHPWTPSPLNAHAQVPFD